MVCFEMYLGGTTDLVFLDWYLNAIDYWSIILENVVLPYAERISENLQLIHNNASPHLRASFVHVFIITELIFCLDHRKSSDLNSIDTYGIYCEETYCVKI